MKKITMTLMSLVVITFAGFAFCDLDSVSINETEKTTIAQGNLADKEQASFKDTVQWWL